MKYIRTGKNDTLENVYGVIGEDELHWKIKDDLIPDCIALIPKCNVVKQADNIEDLADGFWWENEMYDDPIFIPNYGLAIERINSWKESDKKFNTNSLSRIKIYASIYIRGGGWKHIAKINNDSEELELL